MKHKRLSSSPYPAGFLVLRTPLLSFDNWLKWTKQVSKESSAAATTSEKLTEDKAILGARLCDVFADPVVLEALYLTSPSLHNALNVWKREPDSKAGALAGCNLAALFSRLCGRS